MCFMFIRYGFYGDVITESEKYRWMGPKRYDYAGTKVFMRHRSYEAEIAYLEVESGKTNTIPDRGRRFGRLQTSGSPNKSERVICRTNCNICNKKSSRPTPYSRPEETRWSRSKGRFLSIDAAVISNRNERAPDGLVVDAHLSDGLLHLILIKDCPHALYLWHLTELARKSGNPLNFEFVEHHKTPAFTFTSSGNESVWNLDGEILSLFATSEQDFWSDLFNYYSCSKVWRLITNFFFLGPFSFPFAFRLIIIAKYGVSLERGPFDKRTADFLWMLIFGAISLLVMAVVPVLWTPFMGASLVFMIVYIWGREFPNARINIYGVVSLKGFYLPWAMVALDLIFGNPLLPDILGMVAGTYLLLPNSSSSSCRWKIRIQDSSLGVSFSKFYLLLTFRHNPPVTNLIKRNPHAGVTFRGRSYRLNGNRSSSSSSPAPEQQPQQPNANAAADGVAFRGRSYRLDGR
ncbi:hypothetical protein Patl1_20724 [Pistacia atlantica]|uniref:Uncharacterized protein n=1 Tax=Pistacia atlantica TaxID=434234 RepID=A0ACC1BMC6_9ROSI|nr:hypothetical protein Patl1_20724 [Pistacia atlantica]